jgi:hypothetical protein
MVPKLEPEMVEKVMLKAGLKPSEPYIKANARWKCKCLKCNRTVYPSYNQIQQGGGGCPYCAKTKVDLKEVMAIMKKEKLEPLEPYKNSNSKWKCLHLTCGNIVYPRYKEVRIGGGGCGTCRYIKSAKSMRFSTDIAIEIMIQAGLQPLGPYKNKDTPWKSRCLICRKISSPSLGNVKKQKSGCKHCAKNAPVDAKKAEQFIKKAGYEPLEPFTGAVKKWKCRCLVCKKISYPTYSSAVNMNSGCIYCGGTAPLDPKEAVKFMIANKLKPLEPYKNARAAWKCKCLKCGAIVSPSQTNVKRGSGCKYCADIGLEYGKPAFLYVMVHKEFSSVKIGVGNHDSKPERITEHKNYGWVLLKKYDLPTGGHAAHVEKFVFRWIRKELKLPVHLAAEQMPQGGFSETVDADEISMPNLYRIIEDAIKKGLKE